MGCDIHLFVEKKHKGKWICISPLEYGRYSSTYDKRTLGNIYDGRNYELFGWLAQVRRSDEKGFEPKGFPEDASLEIKSDFQEWDVDAHTPSYLNLKELKDKFEGNVEVSGMMDKKQWKKLEKSIKSEHTDWDLLYPHCQYTNGDGYVSFTVHIPIKVEFKHFHREVMDFMNNYTWDSDSEKHEDETVRIVFWFDN